MLSAFSRFVEHYRGRWQLRVPEKSPGTTLFA
jgi:hypothetical protein